MRSLDKKYVTPTLRHYNLLFLNADGFMMTRSLAENYPYTLVYKAQVRGAKREWLLIVEEIENGTLPCQAALHFMISLLLNKQKAFLDLADATLRLVWQYNSLLQTNAASHIKSLVFSLINESEYAARVMEIVMHSFLQVVLDLSSSGLELRPLAQMRSANKKHGNIGDIEIVRDNDIIEAWDAKFGKTYLRDELEELADKLDAHPHVEIVGFVTSAQPERIPELQRRKEDIEALHGVSVKMLTLDEWIHHHNAIAIETGALLDEVFKSWLVALCETLGQKRRNIAPIDEPSHEWLETLKRLLDQNINQIHQEE